MSTSAARAVQTTAPLSFILPCALEPIVDRLRRDNPTAAISVGQSRPSYIGRFQITIVGGSLVLDLASLTGSTAADLIDLRADDKKKDEAAIIYDLASL